MLSIEFKGALQELQWWSQMGVQGSTDIDRLPPQNLICYRQFDAD